MKHSEKQMTNCAHRFHEIKKSKFRNFKTVKSKLRKWLHFRFENQFHKKFHQINQLHFLRQVCLEQSVEEKLVLAKDYILSFDNWFHEKFRQINQLYCLRQSALNNLLKKNLSWPRITFWFLTIDFTKNSVRSTNCIA